MEALFILYLTTKNVFSCWARVCLIFKRTFWLRWKRFVV